MKRFFLICLMPLLALSLKAQEDTSTSGSLDFIYDGITYTIIDYETKTCKTKAGASYYTNDDSPKLIINYGNLTTGDINIPSQVTRIVDDNIEETYTVIAIGDYGFKNVTSVILPETVTILGTCAFNSCANLTSIKMGDGVTTMGSHVFFGCTNLSALQLPSSLTSIPPSAFYNCSSLQEIIIPSSVSSIGERAFNGCKGLTKIRIPDSVVQIGNNAFSNCSSITEVTLPESLTSLPAGTFQNNISLSKITLPASITSIGESTFANCNSLKEVTCLSTSLPAISYNVFSSATYSGTLKVYKTKISAFKKSPIWGNFSNIEAIYVAPTGVTIDKTICYLDLGYTQQLQASILPADASGEIFWSVASNPENAASITQDGRVTAQRIGTAIVTASCEGFTASCDVKILANSKESVTISPIGMPVYVGDQIQMSAIVIPTTITSPVIWASSNPEVATIDPTTGILTGITPGGALITAQCENVTGKLSVTIQPIEAQAVILDKSSLTLKAGETGQILATVLPENTTFPDIVWETSDPNVAIASQQGVTAIGVGTCVIRASCGEAMANCEVTVIETLPESITLNETYLTLKPGQVSGLIALVLPETTTDKTVTYISSAPEVVSVSAEGTVTALSVGTAVITASCGGVSTVCTVTVEPILATEIVLNYNSLNLMVGQVQQLTAIVADEVTDKTIVWTTRDDKVATVNNGLVTATGVGTTIITARNGEVSADCMVSVYPIPVASISLDISNLTLNVGNSETLKVNINPSDATDPTVQWDSSNEAVASVKDGIVTANLPGTATIFASCQNSIASCVVTVSQPAVSLSISPSVIFMEIGESRDIIATPSPEDTTDPVIFESEKPDIASVNEHGIVEGLSVGSSVIIVRCGELQRALTVVVNPISVKQFDLNVKYVLLWVGANYQFVPSIFPENASDKTVDWSSSDENIVKVSSDGMATGISAGEATITAICGDISRTCSVKVNQPEKEEVLIDLVNKVLYPEDTYQLIATVGGKQNENITWTSENEKVLTIDKKGLLIAVSPGESLVTASFNESECTIGITVSPRPASLVLLNKGNVSLKVGESAKLNASVYPENTTDKTVTWVSGNPKVADVDVNGNVIALSEGYSVITAYCGEVFAQCMVLVTTMTDEGNNGDNPGNEGDDNPGNGGEDNPGNGGEDNPGNGGNDNPGNGGNDNPGNGGDDNPGNGGDDNPGNGGEDNPGNGGNDNPGNGGNDNLGNGGDDNPGNGGDDNPGDDVPEDEGGVESIINDNSTYNVFTLTGIKVMSTKDKGDLLRLSTGLYIINGQKVYIRTE